MSKHAEHAHQIVSPFAYVAVYLALLVGLGLTIAAAYKNLGIFNPIIALAIAFSQAGLVVSFTMNARNSSKLIKIAIFSGLFILFTLVSMVMADYVSRSWGSW